MIINYKVFTKAAPHSPWRDTGIIESNKEVALKVWADITKRLRYHDFKLFTITYGIPIDRSVA